LTTSLQSSKFKVDLIDKWAITFGTPETPSDKELTNRLAYITAPWNETAKKYDMPWHVLLAVQPWRTGENGEISAEACPFRDYWDGTYTGGKVPPCSVSPPA
jgi:hypothetical protein